MFLYTAIIYVCSFVWFRVSWCVCYIFIIITSHYIDSNYTH